MLKQTLFSLFLFIISVAACSAQSKRMISCYNGREISVDTLDGNLKRKVEELKIPGLSFALVNNGKIVHHRIFGYTNLEERIQVTEKTIFEGASISKSVFAVFVMKYVEEGKLDLDKPLHEYLPYPDIENDKRYKKITARMVLSHRSGFPNWRDDEPDKKLKIHFEPGTDYEYSGEGYQYLAMVLKHIEDTDWNGLEAAFQEKIAKPLGMEHTVFIQTPYTRAHKAEPYDEMGRRIDKKAEKKEFGAAYSIHSEAADFSKWMIAVMNKKLLKEESYTELLLNHSEVPNAKMKIFYTLGFNTPDKPYHNIYFHGGNNDGFTCWYLLDIEKDWGFVLFTNSEYGQKLGDDLTEFFIGE